MPITEHTLKEELQKKGARISLNEAKYLLDLLKEFAKIQLNSITNN
jgi:hypothetical protein